MSSNKWWTLHVLPSPRSLLYLTMMRMFQVYINLSGLQLTWWRSGWLLYIPGHPHVFITIWHSDLVIAVVASPCIHLKPLQDKSRPNSQGSLPLSLFSLGTTCHSWVTTNPDSFCSPALPAPSWCPAFAWSFRHLKITRWCWGWPNVDCLKTSTKIHTA